MKKNFSEGRTFWLGYLLLALVGLVLGMRCENIVAAVLSSKSQGTAVVGNQDNQGLAESIMISKKDSLLESIITPSRDPFAYPKKPVRRKPTVKRPVQSDIPSLDSLLYAEDASSVQLNVAGERSRWLREGESFHGWTIVNIAPTSVRVVKDVRTFELRSH